MLWHKPVFCIASYKHGKIKLKNMIKPDRTMQLNFHSVPKSSVRLRMDVLIIVCRYGQFAFGFDEWNILLHEDIRFRRRWKDSLTNTLYFTNDYVCDEFISDLKRATFNFHISLKAYWLNRLICHFEMWSLYQYHLKIENKKILTLNMDDEKMNLIHAV